MGIKVRKGSGIFFNIGRWKWAGSTLEIKSRWGPFHALVLLVSSSFAGWLLLLVLLLSWLLKSTIIWLRITLLWHCLLDFLGITFWLSLWLCSPFWTVLHVWELAKTDYCREIITFEHLACASRESNNYIPFAWCVPMPLKCPRSIGVDSTALLSQLILSPMQENEAHDLSVEVPLDLTVPVAAFSYTQAIM